MAEEIRISKNYPNMQQPNMESMRGPSHHGSSKLPWAVLFVVVLALAGTGIAFRDRLFGGSNSSNGQVQGAVSSKPSGYQSVFLTNGQVYFGKIANASGDYVSLSDIYYLQVTQPPLQGSQQNSQEAQAQPQVSLVKLGNELHGPVDAMQINRSQVLFYEDMKEDSKVMQAIREYQKNPNPAGTAPTTQQAPTQSQQNLQQPAVNGANSQAESETKPTK